MTPKTAEELRALVLDTCLKTGGHTDTGPNFICPSCGAINNFAIRVHNEAIEAANQSLEQELQKRWSQKPINCGGDDDYAERVEAVNGAYDDGIRLAMQTILKMKVNEKV